MPIPYIDPLYSHQSKTSGATGTAIDISSATNTDAPPVMICTFTGGPPTYNIEGSHDNVTWFAYVSGATSVLSKDLIIGIRFWRTNVTAFNGATFTSSVGPTLGGTDGDELVSMNYVKTSNTNAGL